MLLCFPPVIFHTVAYFTSGYSHVERLGKGMELDRAFLRAGHLQCAWRNESIEGQLAIGEIGEKEDPVVPAQRHRIAVELQRRHGAGRVVGVVQDEEPRVS